MTLSHTVRTESPMAAGVCVCVCFTPVFIGGWWCRKTTWNSNVSFVDFFPHSSSLLFSPLLQLHGHDRVLASKAGAPTLVLRARVTYFLHLRQLHRGALRPAQHHLRQHRQDESLPFSPRLHFHKSHFFSTLKWSLHVHVPAFPVPLPLPRGARLLHLKQQNQESRRWRTAVRSRPTLDTEWLRKNSFCALFTSCT